MCEPVESVTVIGDLAHAVVMAPVDVVSTKVGRRVLAVVVTGGALYALTMVQVTVPAAAVVGLALSTVTSTFAAIVFWRRSRARAPFLRRVLFPKGKPRLAVEQVRPRAYVEIEEARPRFDEVTQMTRNEVLVVHAHEAGREAGR